MAKQASAVIVGVGPGLGAALGEAFAREGYDVALAARKSNKLDPIVSAIKAGGGRASAHGCDATNEAQVQGLFDTVEKASGPIAVAIYNASNFTRAPIADTTGADFEAAWRVVAFGGFLVGREAARRMTPRGSGTILFTGATASLRGGAQFGAFASGKFALRALVQSMARELQPKGIHVAHFILDGVIGEDADARKLAPAAIADAYVAVHRQAKSAWAQEIDLRPWSEKF